VSGRRRLLVAVALLMTACSRGVGVPRREPCNDSPQPGELGSVCHFENPEDIAYLPEASLLLVSQMRHSEGSIGGSLAALSLAEGGEPAAGARRIWPPDGPSGASESSAPETGDPSCVTPPVAARFSPHGIAAGSPATDGAIPVAVVGHGEREAIELFALRGKGEEATLRWTGCVPLPSGASGNDVILDGEDLWVTNYQPAVGGLRGLYYTVMGGLGRATGEVLRWHAGGWETIAGTRGANPNGLLLVPGSGTLAVAFTGTSRIGLRPLGGTPRDVEVDGRPDNLTLSSRSTLLAPVHTSGLAVLRCRFGALPCASPWKLLEIDLESGTARELLSHDGSRVGGVASVAEVGKRLYFGAIFDDRIGLLLQGGGTGARQAAGG
jgi:hypothetical protein